MKGCKIGICQIYRLNRIKDKTLVKPTKDRHNLSKNPYV